jgi:hypothetical protein
MVYNCELNLSCRADNLRWLGLERPQQDGWDVQAKWL